MKIVGKKDKKKERKMEWRGAEDENKIGELGILIVKP